MLFMECMEENEAILMQGYEQFTRTEGYSRGLQYAGKHHADLEVRYLSTQFIVIQSPFSLTGALQGLLYAGKHHADLEVC